MKKCELCGQEFEGDGVHCSNCAEMMEPEPVKKKTTRKTTKKATPNKKEVKVEEPVVEEPEPVVEDATCKSIMGFIDYLIDTGEKWVISYNHGQNIPRLKAALKTYEEISK